MPIVPLLTFGGGGGGSNGGASYFDGANVVVESTSAGSLLILKVFSRWGLRSAAAHTWATCQTVTP